MAITYNNVEVPKITAYRDGAWYVMYDTTNFDYFTDNFKVGDTINFTGNTITDLTFTVDTPLSGTGVTGVWEYGSSYYGYTALSGVNDPSNGFTTTGTHTLTFDLPNFYGGSRSHNYFGPVIRYRITGVTTATEGGHNNGQVSFHDRTIHIENTDITIEDLYNEDVTNGRGVVSKTGYSYLIDANLYIGDGTNNASLTITNSNIQVGVVGRLSKILIRKYGTLQMGTLSNTIGYGEYGGWSGSFRYYCYYGYSDYQFSPGNVLLYGVSVYMYTGYGLMMNGYSDFRDCNFSGEGRRRHYNAIDSKLIRCNYINLHGPMIYTAKMEIDDVSIDSRYYGFALGFGLTGVIKNSKIINPEKHLYLSNQNSAYEVYDTDYDYDKVYFYHYVYSTKGVWDYKSFKLKVKDKDGNAIDNATITITDSKGTATTYTTDSEGRIGTQNLLKARLIPNGTDTYVTEDMIDRYAPYTLKIEKSGYETYTDTLSMSDKTSLEVALNTENKTMLNVDGDIAILTNPELGTNSKILNLKQCYNTGNETLRTEFNTPVQDEDSDYILQN